MLTLTRVLCAAVAVAAVFLVSDVVCLAQVLRDRCCVLLRHVQQARHALWRSRGGALCRCVACGAGSARVFLAGVRSPLLLMNVFL